MVVFLLASGELIARSLDQSQWMHSSARDIAGSVLLAQELANAVCSYQEKLDSLTLQQGREKQLAFGPISPSIFDYAL